MIIKTLNILEIILLYILAIITFVKKDYFNGMILIILADIERRFYILERSKLNEQRKISDVIRHNK